MTTFETTITPHLHTLRAAARRLCRNTDDAADLVQDTLIRALEAWPSYTAGTDAGAWLAVMCRNLFITRYRAAKRRGRLLAAYPSDIAASTVSASPVVATSPEVVAAVASLRPIWRDVVEGVYLEEGSLAEVGARLGVKYPAMQARLFDARKALRAELAPYAAECGLGI